MHDPDLVQVVKDRSAVTFMGPSATPQQALNASLANCLFHCWSGLSKLEDENLLSAFRVMKSSIDVCHSITSLLVFITHSQKLRSAYDQLVEPILTAMRRELGAIIARLHRIDFGKSADSMAGGGSSFYMKDLAEKLSFIKSEILSKYSVGEDGRAWYVYSLTWTNVCSLTDRRMISIVQYVIRTFVLHVSIAKPLGESGKLQLTSDMTELEFALSAFMVENSQNKRGDSLDTVGDDYRSLRAMR
jgi:hypothetical protein